MFKIFYLMGAYPVENAIPVEPIGCSLFKDRVKVMLVPLILTGEGMAPQKVLMKQPNIIWKCQLHYIFTYLKSIIRCIILLYYLYVNITEQQYFSQ